MSEQEQRTEYSDEISRAGRREWEGEHKVEIRASAPSWDSHLWIDGKELSRDVTRIEIDLDVAKLTPICKLTRYVRDEDGQVPSEEASLKRYTQQLVMNALDLTSDEMLVVDTILESARKAANSEQLAVQLFAIDATDEGDDHTVRITLDALLRDAKRYRGLRNLIAEKNGAIELHTLQTHKPEPYDENDLDQAADELYAAQLQRWRESGEQ